MSKQEFKHIVRGKELQGVVRATSDDWVFIQLRNPQTAEEVNISTNTWHQFEAMERKFNQMARTQSDGAVLHGAGRARVRVSRVRGGWVFKTKSQEVVVDGGLFQQIAYALERAYDWLSDQDREADELEYSDKW